MVSLFDRANGSSEHQVNNSELDRLVANNHRAYAARHHYAHIDCSALLEQQQTADHDADPWLRPHLRKVSAPYMFCSVALPIVSCRSNARLGSHNPHA